MSHSHTWIYQLTMVEFVPPSLDSNFSLKHALTLTVQVCEDDSLQLQSLRTLQS